MKNKMLRICAKISTALFLGFVGLGLYMRIFNPDPSGWMQWRHIPLGYDIKISISNVEDQKWLIFFNGPYPNDTTMLGPTDTITGYEGYGIYYHVIHNSTTKSPWLTLMISLWYPIILFGILPAIFVVKKLRGRKSASTQETVIEK
jgi:hypothetical protein